ncbi:hypothetical protein SEUCBS139899_007074 [Sporothrix eucalyptigena]|uniref:Uncharacterized protein n=1 Tax=Sporothrix eucalyptigena TaxID=1812306 RepID=A0ABP0CPM1_9PEZI
MTGDDKMLQRLDGCPHAGLPSSPSSSVFLDLPVNGLLANLLSFTWMETELPVASAILDALHASCPHLTELHISQPLLPDSGMTGYAQPFTLEPLSLSLFEGPCVPGRVYSNDAYAGYTGFFGGLCRTFASHGGAPLRLYRLSLENGTHVRPDTPFELLVDLACLEELSIRNDNDCLGYDAPADPVLTS